MTRPAETVEQSGPAASRRIVIDGIASDLERRLRPLPYVVGVFFAGSAANDELLVDVRDAGRLLGDVEVGIVTTQPWKKREVRAIAAEVGAAHGAEIDAFLVTRTRLRRGLHKNVGLTTRHATVFAYEISQAARWIYGRASVDCRVWAPGDIHPWEGARLILNRIGEGAPWLAPSDEPGSAFADAMSRARWSIKTLIASGDALLLSVGCFAPSYRGRSRLWELQGSALLRERRACDAVARAYRARAEGIGAEGDVDDTARLVAVRAGVQAGLEASGLPAHLLESRQDASAIRRHLAKARLPTLHTLTGGRLDAAFDSLLGLPRLRRAEVRTTAVLADWRGRGCLQHWAYAPLIAGLGEATSDAAFATMREAIAPFAHGGAASDRECVRRWWQLMCK